MKKIISLFLSFSLVFSLSAFAFADDELLNYRWRDVEKIVQETFGYDGNNYFFEEVNTSCWLPDEFSSVDPSSEGMNDCLGFFISPTGNSYVLVNYIDSNGLDLDSYCSYYNQQNGANIYKILVNDIPALEQDNPDSFMVMFQTQEGKFLQFLFSPLSNPVFGLVMSSIQSTVAEDSTPVESSSGSAEVSEPEVSTNPVSGLIYK